MTPFQTASERLGAFCAVVIIARIKSGNLVLPGERVYNISEEEAPPPPYEGREILPPYVEVAAPQTQDICSSLGISTEPAQQRSREAGERISPPMAAPASCVPPTITVSSSPTHETALRTPWAVSLGIVGNVRNVTSHSHESGAYDAGRIVQSIQIEVTNH
ncbi:hypothetical protein R3P38DRAFT_2786930 [Favolaschia claudopus]|uniref:Uncharacterized protein n=1 Tax=Favolaschia claudopus TaxID=2862362 RepID=A0AAW0AR46_9AGAR